MGRVEVADQIILIFAALLLGMLTGFLFDIYRRLRNTFSPGPFLTALGDLCFWGVITTVTFYSLYQINFGQVRGYFILNILVGLFIYISFFSPFVIRCFVIIQAFVNGMIQDFIALINRLKRLRLFALPIRIIKDARHYFDIKKR